MPNVIRIHLEVCFLEVDKTCIKVFGLLPKLLKNFPESDILICSAMVRMKTALGIIQLWFRKFPKNIAGRTKRPCGPHAGRVFETPGLMQQLTSETTT